jgi:glyoxalase family protein
VKLEGIHHVTCITADAPGNVRFHADVLGLRLVKKSVNQDDPTVYHLFYADEHADYGSDITFFEYPGARRGRAGAGMVHTITWRVASEEALSFWEERLSGKGVDAERHDSRLVFHDPEGLRLELAVVETADAPLIADHPEIPAELALQGFDGVQAFSEEPERSRPFFQEALEFEPREGTSWEARGDERGSTYQLDPPPASGPGLGGAGTVHHVAWACRRDEQGTWRQGVIDGGGSPTEIIDRFYFKSIYFREPSGVLFEIATFPTEFTADEPLEHLGEKLSLPPAYEHLRDQVEPLLTPLPSPRPSRV